jgi:hypothetical protein
MPTSKEKLKRSSLSSFLFYICTYDLGLIDLLLQILQVSHTHTHTHTHTHRGGGLISTSSLLNKKSPLVNIAKHINYFIFKIIKKKKENNIHSCKENFKLMHETVADIAVLVSEINS